MVSIGSLIADFRALIPRSIKRTEYTIEGAQRASSRRAPFMFKLGLRRRLSYWFGRGISFFAPLKESTRTKVSVLRSPWEIDQLQDSVSRYAREAP